MRFNLDVIGKRKIWYTISIAIVIIGLAVGLIRGFNWGIDFTGGTMMQIDLAQDTEVKDIEAILKAHDVTGTVVKAGEDNQEVIIRTVQNLDSGARAVILQDFFDTYKIDNSNIREVEQFGPSVGSELQKGAMIAIMLASLMMLIYIAFRFEIRFGIAAIAALIYDLTVMIAIYGAFHVQINSPFVAALLVILGYSINNTIVIFDRIRENIKLEKKMKTDVLVNKSINQTLTRTTCTSITTLLAITALFFMGTSSIKEFTFPIIAGLIAGTYSSIFISGSLWYDINRIFAKKKHKGKAK